MSLDENDKHVDSSLYILCVLIFKHTEEAKKDIRNIAKNISAEYLNKVIEQMESIEKKEKKLQYKGMLATFTQLKIQLLCDEVWLKHLELKDIISLSANDDFYLHGLIALIRKHAKTLGHADQFLKFDFDALQGKDAEHIMSTVCDIVAQIETLPLDDFKSFAKDNVKLARSVLKFLQSHRSKFEMGAYFLEQHKELRSEIYTNWHETKESALLTESKKAGLSEFTKVVGKTYPEFNEILKTEGVKRELPDTINETKRNYDAMGLAGLGTFGMAISLVPKYAALTGVVASAASSALAGQAVCVACLSAAALPVAVPTSIVLLMGGATYLARNGVEENKTKEEKLKPPPWASSPFNFKLGV